MDAELSLDRARVYRALARLFRAPEPELIRDLRRQDAPVLRDALRRIGASAELLQTARRVLDALGAEQEALRREYDRVFDASAGLQCAPNETAHTPDSPQEAWTRTYQLADIAGFYRAFGVQIAPGSERADHIAAELEFMHLLAIKQAFAETSGERDRARICREAAALFLRDHLDRWCTRLRDRLAEIDAGGPYGQAGALLAGFVDLDTLAIGPAPAHRPHPNPAL